MLINILQSFMFFFIQESFGTSISIEKGSSGCIGFIDVKLIADQDVFFIKRNQSSICYISGVSRIPSKIGNGWNRSFTCNYSLLNFDVCIDNAVFSDSGDFSLFSNGYLQNITLEVEGPPIVQSMKNINAVEGSSLSVPCSFINGYPIETKVFWVRFGYQEIYENGATLNITNIQRNISGTFICVAENLLSSGKKGHSNESVVIDVQYPPFVKRLKEQVIVEGKNLNATCQATPGNPSNTTFYWTKVDGSGFMQNGTTLKIPNIQRNSSGTYRCTAENNYSNGEKGTDSQTMVVNIQYPPMVLTTSTPAIIEGNNLSVTCEAKPGNPNSTTFFWTKVNSTEFKQIHGPILQLLRISRNSSGTYTCTAENIYNDKEKGMHSQSMVMNVQYPPEVKHLPKNNIEEGKNLSVTCDSIPGYPTSTKFHWTKVNDTGFKTQTEATLQLPNIQRTSSGTYRCTAENSYTNGGNGRNSQTTVVNVQYKPSIEKKPQQIVNESEQIIITRAISSNPSSDVYWYIEADLIRIQRSVTVASFTKENATCADTKNFTLVASNGIGNNDTVLVELIVNCKPKPEKNNITLGVTESTGIQFSSTVVAYPKPLYQLKHTNGTVNNEMNSSLVMHAVNIFTIRFNQTVVKQSDYGIYQLRISNEYGFATVFVNVLPQMRPDIPRNLTVNCDQTGARIQWISGFNGGDAQTFKVFILIGKDKSSSDRILDNGENLVHSNYIQNLQPSVTYVFYVSAFNQRGYSSSDNLTCTTLKKESSENLPLIVGLGSAGGITLAIVFILAVLFLRRFTTHEKQGRKSHRLKNEVAEDEEENDDGMKDNILYVSAGPKVDEKPDAAVYAAVNKKAPESNNNANVYAEVNKSGHKIAEGALYSDVKPKRGLFKKDVNRKKDGNPKQKKGKKQKSKQDVADVYENSEDIAMSSKSDNVYSNTEQKVQNKEERGYKNKDGLLYVEVQFDAKTEKGNQTIHGEDEKTDYATVEFPMAASKHDESGNEKNIN